MHTRTRRGPAKRVRTALLPAIAAATLLSVAACSPPEDPGTLTPGAAGTSTTAPAASAEPTHAPIPAAELRRLAIPALRFDQPTQPLTSVEMGNAINPPLYRPGRPSAPVRISDKGVQPSSKAKDTVYVGCHSSTKHGPDQYPCDVLTRRVTPGMSVVAATEAGTLIYTVQQTRSIPYADFASDEQTWRVEPKRLVLVMCDILDGRSTQANYVIYATLA